MSPLFLSRKIEGENAWAGLLRVRMATGLACGLAHLYDSSQGFPAHAPVELHSGAVLISPDFVPKLSGVRRVAGVGCHQERTNVFHMGTILWELLTRRSVAAVSHRRFHLGSGTC
jgi:hypothetical protein